MAQFQNLPIEIFLSIFKQLSPQDLKSAVLVSKSWQEVGEDPALWTWAVVRVDSRHDFEKFNIQRLQLLRELKVNCTRPASQYYSYWNVMILSDNQNQKCIWNELFKLIREIPTVRRISGSSCENCFSSVEPDLLVNVLNSLQELHVGWSGSYV